MANGTIWATVLCLITLNLSMALSFAMVANPLLAGNNPEPFHAPQDLGLSASMFGDGEAAPGPAMMEQRIGLGDPQGEGDRLEGLKRGDLVEDCVRKARLVYYRSQVSQDQPEFVRVCKMMWKTWISAKSPDLGSLDLRTPVLKSLGLKSPNLGSSDLKSPDLKRSKTATWAKWANRALRMNGFLNHNTYFIPRRLFYRVRVADQKRGGISEGLSEGLSEGNEGRSNNEDMQDSQYFDSHFDEVPNAQSRPTKIRESSGNDKPANDFGSESSEVSSFPDLESDASESRFRMKRSPWAGSENRYNVLDMLRSRLHARGKKYFTAHASGDLQRLSAITAHALRRLKRGTQRDTWYPEVIQGRGYGHGYGFGPDVVRVPQGKRSPRPSERHPFVGGLGDYAAEMALQTYAQLLQNQLNNENRLGEGADKTTRNARPFIG
jgi:hypothetical protein